MMGGGRGKKSRKMRGGNFYGFKGALDGGTNGASWGAVENVGVDKSGNPVPDAVMPKVGGRRRVRRTSKKGTRKGRKHQRRRRTMRGGASWYSPSNAGGSFAGKGTAGLISLDSYAVNRAPGGPVEGADGVMRV